MALKGHRDNQKVMFNRRAVLLSLGTVGLFGGLVTRMVQLQIRDSEKYKLQAEENRVNRQILAPDRGKILDRFGQELASNRPNYQIIMVPEQVENIDATLNRVADWVELTPERREEILRKVNSQRAFVPVTVAANLTWEEFSRLNLELPELPGIIPEESTTRHYVLSKEISHVVGYVAEPSSREVDASDDPLLRHPGFRIGKSGVERELDGDLRGTRGVRFVEVNAYGRVVDEIRREEGTPGRDAVLTLDKDLQDVTAKRIAGESAAVVVMDVHSGDVLAMVSAPGFDPNLFNVGISSEDWRALTQNEKKPLLNKIMNGLYPPGSTFKMLVALAGLEAGKVRPNDKTFCGGTSRIGRFVWHCWKKGGHGPMDMRDAIKQSCNVYFYELAKRLDIQEIADMARRFGLGAETGIEVPGEKAGTVPDREWKRAQLNEVWHPGETLNTAIGQGYLQVSPIQMAVMTARMVNGGMAVNPRLVRSVGDKVIPAQAPEPIGVDPAHLELIKDAMFSVTNEWRGTAFRHRIEEEGLSYGGKTGTVQVRRITQEERNTGVIKNEDLPWRQRDHGWFVGYGPTDNPKYACAVLVEHGGGGSKAAAPVAKDVLYEAMKRDPSNQPVFGPVAVSQSIPAGVETGAPGMPGPEGEGI